MTDSKFSPLDLSECELHDTIRRRIHVQGAEACRTILEMEVPGLLVTVGEPSDGVDR